MEEVRGSLLYILGLVFCFVASISWFALCFGVMPRRMSVPALSSGAGLPDGSLLLAVELRRLEPETVRVVFLPPPINKLGSDESDESTNSDVGFFPSKVLCSLCSWLGYRGGDAGIVWESNCWLMGRILNVDGGCVDWMGSEMLGFLQELMGRWLRFGFQEQSLRSNCTACWFDSVGLSSSLIYRNPNDNSGLFSVGWKVDDACMEMHAIRICAPIVFSQGNFGSKMSISVSYCWMRVHRYKFGYGHPTSSCYLQWSIHTSYLLSAMEHANCAFLLSGTCRRELRSPLLRFLRFDGKDHPQLGSVMHPTNLQLSSLPHSLPTRLLVEPLACRLVRVLEAPGEYSCRFCVSDFSADPLIGSSCALWHSCCVAFIVHLRCILYQDVLCNHYVVLSPYQ